MDDVLDIHVYGTPAAIIASIVVIILLLYIIQITINYIRNKKIKVGFHDKRLFISCIITYVLYILYGITWIIVSLTPIPNYRYCFIPWSTQLLLVMGKLSVYTYFLLRLHVVFYKSAYGYQRSFLIKFEVSLILFCILFCCLSFLQIIHAYIKNHIESTQINCYNDCYTKLKASPYFYITIILFVVGETITSIFLLILFAKKLS